MLDTETECRCEMPTVDEAPEEGTRSNCRHCGGEIVEHPTFDYYEGVWQFTHRDDDHLVTLEGSEEYEGEEPLFNCSFVLPFYDAHVGIGREKMVYHLDGVPASKLTRATFWAAYNEEEQAYTKLRH